MCCSKSKRNHFRIQPYRQVSDTASPVPKQIIITKSETPKPLQQISPPSYEQVQKYSSPIDPSPQPDNQIQIYQQNRTLSESNGLLSVPNELSELYQPVYANAIQSQIECVNPLGHEPKTKYGAVGIIAGIVFFPWGLFWTKCDSQVICRSCQAVLRPKGGHCHSRRIDGKHQYPGGYGSCSSKRRRRYCGSRGC